MLKGKDAIKDYNVVEVYIWIGVIGILGSGCFLFGNVFINSGLGYMEVEKPVHIIWSLLGIFCSLVIIGLGFIISELSAIKEQLRNR